MEKTCDKRQTRENGGSLFSLSGLCPLSMELLFYKVSGGGTWAII